MKRASEPTPGHWRRLILRASGAAGLMAALTACLPTFEIAIPEPTGSFPVGITQEILLDRVSPLRAITLDIWYPAGSTTGYSKAPYVEKALGDIQSKIYGIPSFLNSEVPSFSHQGAPPAPGRHPVVIFNHGYASFSKQNFSNFQELASHGYVVISLAHPGESLAAKDATGSLVPLDMQSETYLTVQRIQKDMGAYVKQLAPILERQRQASTPEAYTLASGDLARDPQYAALQPQLRRWLRDTREVIGAIQGSHREGAFEWTAPGNITVMGHSLGGAVAMHLATEPPEGVRGIINLDGPWFHDDSEPIAPIRVPSLNLLSTHNMVENQDLAMRGTLHSLYRGGSAGAHIIEVKGASHLNFTDLNFLPVLKFASMLGPVDSELMITTQNQAIMEFLKRTTQGGAVFETPLIPESPALTQHVISGTERHD